MKLLLDHCVDRRLADHLAPHEVQTAAELGWHQYRNGRLLAAAAAAGFDAMLTTDKGMLHQQNQKTLPISVVILRAVSNRLSGLVPLIEPLQQVIESLPARQVIELAVPDQPPKRNDRDERRP